MATNPVTGFKYCVFNGILKSQTIAQDRIIGFV